ncbi:MULTISPECIES: AraC family transcriptional regulator [unclassified Thalassospira]|uniref:AraC family transcriptional regulator n=1 Tax=unclassified Thalassospira TaxID=2648997 RepID=UPI000EDE777D|nr:MULTISPECIES: AraC family transcriptional regulator [unclassified Thalassospira]MBO6809281.1 AraC family transcriptional regulator [Thalassospira sp.]MBO6842529.1 AraC family transcriptional regulator [Thalassospira sp.]HAI30490.1 AraC family transcriptional regulator CmrA [Thalassospira sp.]|tara:strand:- start:9032 stop:9958 length:927 start_codon:yes stop_codon:yes gene_type:complete
MDSYQRLCELIDKYCEVDGAVRTAIDPVWMYRATNPTLKVPTIYKPCLCLIISGAKEVTLGQEVYRYEPGQLLAASVDLPLVGHVTNASEDAPYRSLSLDLDGQILSELVTNMDLDIGVDGDSTRGLFVEQTTQSLVDAVLRVVDLLDRPDEIPVMLPLLMREVHYRLLCTGQGVFIARLAMGGSNMQRISAVLRLMKDNFDKPLRVDELAQHANMSPSSFHHHFKQVTAMSPLQYQKRLRLTTARQIMLAEMKDAASAAYAVGYESTSQFSREYARMFGAPPMRDITAILGQPANTVSQGSIPGSRF